MGLHSLPCVLFCAGDPCSPWAACSSGEAAACESWGCSAASCFPCRMGRWQPDIPQQPEKPLATQSGQMPSLAGGQASPFPAHPVALVVDPGGPGLEIHVQGGTRV